MSQMAIALIILAATIVLFIWEPVPILVTAIGASIAYAYAGIIPVGDIFKGYNSNTIVLLAGMMIVGSSLFHTGLTDIIGEKMVKITGKSERNIVLATLIVSCALSSVCSNIGVMTAMAPLVTAMCFSAGCGSSRTLMALLFGAQFGGFVTLVGVGSNASAANAMADLGLTPFGFFGITPFGLGICVLGTLYFTFVGMKFLPDTGYVPEFAKVEKKPFDKNKAAIDWNCMLLVGSLTVISTGVQKSGAGAAMAELILQILGEHPSTFMITTVIFIAAAILTQVMSNIPTIMLFMPIGVSIAKAINVSPYPICMIITLAGAASYATPFAAPQNMMTVGWTQYRFVDYVKAGLPMLLVTYLVIVAVIPFYLPY